MRKIANIIFDLDGTLIDSSDGVVEAVNYSLEKMGEKTRAKDEITPYIGYPLSQMYPKFSDLPVKDLYHHFQIRAAETVVSSTAPLPGAEEVLKQLKSNDYQMYIATTKIKKHVEGIIDKLNWSEYFIFLAGGDDIEKVKPAPDIFNLILNRENLNPDETIVVGDTENDVKAAKAISLAVVAVESPYGDSDNLIKSRPDFFIKSITQLPGLLNEI